jgi:hypothetical protein
MPVSYVTGSLWAQVLLESSAYFQIQPTFRTSRPSFSSNHKMACTSHMSNHTQLTSKGRDDQDRDVVRCAHQQRCKLHCVIEGLLPAVVLEELIGIGGVPAPQASVMGMGWGSVTRGVAASQCTVPSPAGAASDECAHPWMSMPLSCGASRSIRPLLSSDRSAAFCRAAQPARRAVTAA